LELTGEANPDKTPGWTVTGMGPARQEVAINVFARFFNRTKPFQQSKPIPLAGYPYPLISHLITVNKTWSDTGDIAILFLFNTE